MKNNAGGPPAHHRLPMLALATATLLASEPASAQTRYTASWTSLDTHTPSPEWFMDAKFGIYYHWGPWCVAAYGSEWYPRNMYHKGSGEYNNQTSKYGDPFTDWGYDKFLTGGKDKQGNLAQFAPKLKSEGGAWDPEAWAQLFADAGARFAGPVAEHHDGYSMWDSKVNEWNSVALGPKLNLAKVQVEAIRKKGLRIVMSQHTAYNLSGYYDGVPAQNTDSLKKLFGQLPSDVEQTLWLNKLKEIIDEFLPDIIWQDFNLPKVSEANLTAFLAYYYNAGLDAGKEVVATAKDGIVSPHKGQVLDYERGGPADITKPYWLTDDAVSWSSWSYTQGMQYYTTSALLHSFIDRVSKGGNLLLNLSPMADGTFPQAQKDILVAFGKLLRQAGTAIYNTRAWVVYGEGPTKLGGGGMTQPTAMTKNDVRYTASKDGDAVYALLMGWPGSQVTLASVTSSRLALGAGKVFLFGPNGDGQGATALAATQDASGLHITLPSTAPYQALAYALKISKSGTEPAATPWTSPAENPDGGAGGADGSPDPDAGTAGTGGRGGATGSSGRSAMDSTGATGGATGGVIAAGGNGSSTVRGGTTATTTKSGEAGTKSGASGGALSSSGGVSFASTSQAGSQSGVAGQQGSASSSGASRSSGCTCSLPNRASHTDGLLLILGLAIAHLVRRRRR